MALIKCPECEGQVSSQAPSCPTCGHPINTAMVQQEPQQMTQHQSSSAPSAHEIGHAVADPLIAHHQKKSSGGAIGALIGATLGYFLMASACDTDFQTLTLMEFTMSLFFWSPVIGLGMIMGYFFGKAVS